MNHFNNRAIAAYLLWKGSDGTPDAIQEAYDELRALHGKPPRDLEVRRFVKIQSAMCSEYMAAIVGALKLVVEKEKPDSATPLSG